MIVASKLSVGGLEGVIESLARGLPPRGIDVDVVCGTIERHASRAYLGRIASEISHNSPWRMPSRLIRTVAQKKPDILMSTADDVAMFALMASKLITPQPKVLVSQHASTSGSSASTRTLSEGMRLEAMHAMLAFAAKRADSCIAVSKGIASELVALGAPYNRVEVIYNPVIGDDTEQRIKRKIPWPWPDQLKPTVVFCGRLDRVKRPGLMLEAFAICRARLDARLLVIGDGPLMGELRSGIRERGLEEDARTIGFVEDPLPYFARCDVLALSSDSEGFGNVLVEGMAAGCKVVATDCPTGPAEILCAGRFGTLVPRNSPEKLAEALVDALTGKCPADAASRRARANEFSESIALSAYERSIHRLTSR